MAPTGARKIVTARAKLPAGGKSVQQRRQRPIACKSTGARQPSCRASGVICTKSIPFRRNIKIPSFVLSDNEDEDDDEGEDDKEEDSDYHEEEDSDDSEHGSDIIGDGGMERQLPRGGTLDNGAEVEMTDRRSTAVATLPAEQGSGQNEVASAAGERAPDAGGNRQGGNSSNAIESRGQPPQKRIKLEEGANSGQPSAHSMGEPSAVKEEPKPVVDILRSPKNSHLKDQLECPICFELFDEPKMLSCGHTYCELCIQKMADNQPGGSGSRRRTIRCPQCRAAVVVPAKGLKTNHLIKSMVNKLKEEDSSSSRVASTPTVHHSSTASDTNNCLACVQCGDLTDKRKMYICTDRAHIRVTHAENSGSGDGNADGGGGEYWNMEEVLCAVCVISHHRDHATHSYGEVISAEDRDAAIRKLEGIRESIELKHNSLLDTLLSEFTQISQSHLSTIEGLVNEVLDFERMRLKPSLQECVAKAERLEQSLVREAHLSNADSCTELIRNQVSELLSGNKPKRRRIVVASNNNTNVNGDAAAAGNETESAQIELLRSIRTTSIQLQRPPPTSRSRSPRLVDVGHTPTTTGQLSSLLRRPNSACPALPAIHIKQTIKLADKVGEPIRKAAAQPLPPPILPLSSSSAGENSTNTTTVAGHEGVQASNGVKPNESSSAEPSIDAAPTRGGNAVATSAAAAGNADSNGPSTVRAAQRSSTPSTESTGSRRSKRNLSAFAMWLEENRGRISQQPNVRSVNDVARQAGREWRALPAKDQEVWEKRAALQNKQ